MPGPGSVACPKPMPRVVEKVARHRQRDDAEHREKTKVRQRDRYRCVICGKPAIEVHEIVPKSRGGVPPLTNSITLCGAPNGCCHALVQQHHIDVEGAPNRAGTYRYVMSRALAKTLFGKVGHRPAHVRFRKAA